jgi:hypothetical protein
MGICMELKNNGLGEAIAGNVNRGGAPQHDGLENRQIPSHLYGLKNL